MSLSLRSASESDLPFLTALENETFSFPRSEGEIERSLSSFLIAEENGAPLGYADMTAVLDEGYMGNIAVLPHSRGRGAGRMLMEGLLSLGRDRELAFLTLEVRESNLPARRLYERCGFEVVAVRKNVYEKPTENAVLMTYFFKEGT